MNNLFDFATGELSQDAVLCWCVNWLNYKDSELYPLAKDMLKLLCPQLTISDNEEVVIIRQWYKTDILLYLKESSSAIIVEDKVYTSEHDNQIQTYVNKINSISEREKAEKQINNISAERLCTTYLKTGFLYDYDKKVKANATVGCIQLLDIINKYKDLNIILSYFAEHLKGILEWYEKHGEINMNNVRDHQIAQYNLMRYIFPESLWNRSGVLYEVYHGSNRGGRPWTEMVIYKGVLTDGRTYHIFWRIDTDSNGPYMSLRLYDGAMDKSNGKHKSMHYELFDYYQNICKSICSKMTDISWDDIKYRETRNYKESTLARFDLSDIISNWNDRSDIFKAIILEYSNNFLKECQICL